MEVNSSLVPPLLKSVYEHSDPKAKAKIAHLLSKWYDSGINGLPLSRTDALYWLEISAYKHHNLEDAYRVCCLKVIDPGMNLSELITICRHLVSSPKILEKYGATRLQIFLARFLIEAGEKEDNASHFEEAIGWLLRAFNDLQSDSLRRANTLWHISRTNKRGKFVTAADTYVQRLATSTPLQRGALRGELGFLHLWGDPNERSLENARQYLAGSNSNAHLFLARMISHYLESRNIGRFPFYRPHDSSREALVPFQTPPRLYLTGPDYDPLELACSDPLKPTDAQSEIAEEEETSDEEHPEDVWNIYNKVNELLYNLPDLSTQEKETLSQRVMGLSRTTFEKAALFLSNCFANSLFGLSRSTEHEIYWLKLAAEKGCPAAQEILATKYPLVMPLTEEAEIDLYFSRVFTDNQPDLAIVGGGFSALVTAILFAKAKAEGNLSIGKITVVERNQHILTGASMMVCRQHRGGEYPKDLKTAIQCLYGSMLWEQMFQTERMRTPQKTNDFLLARESRDDLSEEVLKSHYAFLNERYQQYLTQFDDPIKAQELLFGAPSIFKVSL